jgi:hypothetical protein
MYLQPNLMFVSRASLDALTVFSNIRLGCTGLTNIAGN